MLSSAGGGVVGKGRGRVSKFREKFPQAAIALTIATVKCLFINPLNRFHKLFLLGCLGLITLSG
jgi:hypothetical protein